MVVPPVKCLVPHRAPNRAHPYSLCVRAPHAPRPAANYCVNSCTYCAFRAANTGMDRSVLTDQDLIDEVAALERQGHRRILALTGESPKYTFEQFLHVSGGRGGVACGAWGLTAAYGNRGGGLRGASTGGARVRPGLVGLPGVAGAGVRSEGLAVEPAAGTVWRTWARGQWPAAGMGWRCWVGSVGQRRVPGRRSGKELILLEHPLTRVLPRLPPPAPPTHSPARRWT